VSFPYLQDLLRAATGIDVPLPVPTFGLCVLGAALISISVAKREVRRRHELGEIGFAIRRVRKSGSVLEVATPPQDIVLDFGLISVLAGIVGARVFSMLEVPGDFLAHPWALIFSRQGFNFFGGLVFGVGTGILYFLRHRLPVLRTCDAFAPAMMLGYALGRIGCQLAGDGDWGVTANIALKPDWLPTWLWAQTYDNNILREVIPPPGVYPTPLYEIAMGLLAFAVLWGLRQLPRRPGWLFCVYLLLGGLERSAIELIRVNPQMSLLGLAVSQAQVIAVALTVIGAVGMVALGRRR